MQISNIGIEKDPMHSTFFNYIEFYSIHLTVHIGKNIFIIFRLPYKTLL